MLEWTIEIRYVGERGRAIDRDATPTELEEVARDIDVVALRSLSLAGKVRPLSRGRFALEGRIAARVVQSCVVTLEPVESDVVETLSLELWPQADLEGAAAAFATTGPEAYDGERIDLGVLVVEHLAAALDPFPRKEGVALDWQGGGNEPVGEKSQSPFAVLGQLKKRGEPER